jgi:hypothetical protein
MAKQNARRFQEVVQPTAFEEARDELFQQIVQCGVIGAEPEHQIEWFGETMAYVSDRYPELSAVQLAELRTLGDRFVQPAKRAPQTADASAA